MLYKLQLTLANIIVRVLRSYLITQQKSCLLPTHFPDQQTNHHQSNKKSSQLPLDLIIQQMNHPPNTQFTKAEPNKSFIWLLNYAS